MLMMPERKKALTVIIEGLGDGESSGPSDYDYALKTCASKVMECVASRDVDGFCEHMKEFMEMCKGEEKPMEMDY